MIKSIKGILLFLVSLAVAVSLLLNPSTATLSFLPYIGVTLISLSIYFVISGIMNLIIGLTGARWNALWFVPYFLYTGLLWLWYSSTGYKVQAASIPSLLTLLTAYLVLDIAEEYKENRIADGSRSASGGSSGSSRRDGLSGIRDIPIPPKPDQE